MKKQFLFIISLFTINVYAQDYCTQADVLPINSIGNCNTQTFSMGADLDNQDDNPGDVDININTACANPSGNWNAYWATFTGNGNSVDIVISNPNKDGFAVIFENTPCGGTMNELTCFNFSQDIGGGTTINTTNGSTYTVAVFRVSGWSSMTGEISVSDNPTNTPYDPICDQCSIYGSAPTLTVNPTNTDCFVNPNIVVTDDDLPMPTTPGCTSGNNWYFASFIATTTVTNAYLWGKEEDDLSISILEGPCNALTQVACVSSTQDEIPSFLQANTIPGQEYFILITTTSGMTTANLCLYEPAPVEPDKPFCSGGMSFEDGAGNGWDGSHGAYHATDISLTNYVWDDMTTGIPQPAKGEVTSGTGYDPIVGMIPIVAPGGGSNSFRLGSLGTAEGYGPIPISGYSTNVKHASCEVMSFCFTVDANNAGFGYKYAIVMDYSSHSAEIQPKMEVFIEDACTGGSLLACGQYEHYPNDGFSEFHFVGDNFDLSNQNDGPIFTFWTDVATDLSNYIGQDVRVTFRIRDCEGGNNGDGEIYYGGHWAYAYIDTYCAPLNIISPEFCAGTGSIQICAPDGYTSYNWPAGQPGVVGPLNQQCITINNPVAGDTYTVNMMSASGCPVTKQITLSQIPVIAPPDTTFICPGDPTTLTITPTGTNGPYTYSWSTGETTSSINVSPNITTTYNVTITNNSGCSSTYSYVVAIDPACTPITVTLSNATICNNDCTNIEATTSGTSGNVTYNWSPNIGNGPGPYNVCPTTTTDYSLTITDATGATSSATSTITVNPIYNLTENVNACQNENYTYPDGTSEVINANTSHTSNLTSVAGCDSIIVTNVTMIPDYNLTENVNACQNENYTYPDGTSEVINANTSHTSNLTSVSGCDSIIVTNVTMNSVYNLTENVNACQNENYTYPDGTSEVINANTSHTSNLTSVNGCDSIIVTNVTMNSVYNLTENVNACQNENYTYPDGTSEVINANTSHTSNLTTVAGCDSIIVTNVTMNPVYNLTENIEACLNATVTYPDGTTESIAANTSHTSNLTTVNNCDSVIVTNVTLITAYNITQNVNACQNENYTYPDGTSEVIIANTSHTSNLTSVTGCDSIIVTNVTMIPDYNLTENVNACQNENYTYPDGTSEVINANTSHTSNLTSVTGCDSIIVTNVTMIPDYNLTENVNACQNENYTYPDGTSEVINANTSHTSNLTSVTGCDSIIVTNVTLNPIYNLNENIDACQNSTITYPDGTTEVINANSSHTSNLTSITGCDSIIVTNVTLITAYNIAENVNVCQNENYTYPDGSSEIINANTTHTSNLTSVTGCDSIIVTNVTMSPVYNLTENINVCQNENYTYPDGTSEVINANTSHTSNLTSINGCDSIIVTNISMTPIYNLTENINVCQNESYTYPDGSTEVIVANTSHTSNLSTVVSHCDSIIVTNIIMNQSSTTIIDATICEGTDYTYPDGTTHTTIVANESYTSQYIAVNGCDSLIVTNLTVSPIPDVFAGNDQVVCEGNSVTLIAVGADNYVWNNGVINNVSFTPNTTTTYTVIGTDINGCSNSDDVTITVAPIPVVTFEGDTLFGCNPLAVNFTNFNTNNGDDCIWDFGDGTTANDCGNITTIYDTPGIYDVSLTTTSINGCTATTTYSNYITIYQTPNAQFSMSQQTISSPYNLNVIFTNQSTNALNYTWIFNDGSPYSHEENPNHDFIASAVNGYTIQLIADDGNVCFDTAQAYLPLFDELIFYVPNAFTPDNDARNNVFTPVFTSGYDPYDYHLIIFNRWGEIVFESFNAEVGWDGTYDNQIVEDGVYVWKIVFKENKTDKKHQEIGHVTLLR